MSKKSRANKARRAVQRAERVPPSALAEAKKRRWSMTILLEAGREGGGLEADQYEAAIEIVACYRAITGELSYKGGWSIEALSIRNPEGYGNARNTLLYRTWCAEIMRRLQLRPDIVVAWIEDTARPIAVELLARALDLWLATRSDLDNNRLTVSKRIDNLPMLATSVGADHQTGGLPLIMSGPAHAPAPALSQRAVGQVQSATPARAQSQARPAPSISKR